MNDLTNRDALLGRTIGGRVELTARIGAGGMGRVYKGWHKTLSTVVAVKVINPAANQTEYGKRLAMELMAIRRLDHPNIVKVLESGSDPVDGLFYVVMELVEGRDLGTLIEGGKALPAGRACLLVREALLGLESAHAQNVLHRDIKPGNLMLTRRKRADGTWADHVKVVDFGLAKVGDATSLTESGFVAGTPGYMSPEQAMGEPLDARTDVYACGVTLYRLLAGHMPFRGERLAAVFQAMQRDPAVIEGLDPLLWRVVARALARERDKRFSSARAFAHALEPFVDERDARGAMDAPNAAPLRVDAALGRAPAAARSPDVPSLHLDAALGLAPAAPRPDVAPAAPMPPPPGVDAALGLAPVAPRPPEVPPLHLDAALGLAPDSSQAHAVTVNQRGARELASPSPPPVAQLPAAPPVVTPPSAEPLGASGPTLRTWLAFGAAVLVGAVLGAVVNERVRSARTEVVLDSLTRSLALGTPEEAERELMARLPNVKMERSTELVARRLLALRRAEAAYPFDPSFVLTPTTWSGVVNGHKLTFVISRVDGWAFEGVLTWNDEAKIAARGVWEGNELLFSDVSLLEGSAPGYVFDEVKLAFVANAASGVVLTGYDGPRRVPMRLSHAGGSVGAVAVDEREWPSPEFVDELELTTYLRAWHETTRLQSSAVPRLEALGSSASALAALQAELRERQRRLQRGLDPTKAAAVDAVVSALFLVQLGDDGQPVLVRRARKAELAQARARLGPLVDRVVAHEALLLTEL